MTIVRLDHPDQHAIALHEHGDGYSITIGNIPDEDALAAQLWLSAQAALCFGEVELAGSQQGTVPGRSEVYVVVNAPLAKVHRFLDEVLKITSNQLH